MSDFTINSLDTLFLFLINSTMCIPHIYQDRVHNDMAYKLEEWASISRDELRTVFSKYSLDFKEKCYSCNEDMPDFTGWGNPICKDCKKEDDRCCEECGGLLVEEGDTKHKQCKY